MAKPLAPLVHAVYGNTTKFLFSGAAEGSLAAGRALGASSVLFLVPGSAAQAAEDAAAAAALGFAASASVGVDAPAGLTPAVAHDCVAALAKLPRPVLVTCASGKRASAVVAIATAREGKMTSGAVLDWSARHELPFLSVPSLRSWVVADADEQTAAKPALR